MANGSRVDRFKIAEMTFEGNSRHYSTIDMSIPVSRSLSVLSVGYT